MFIGYQNELKAMLAETREELENVPMMKFTKIEEVAFAEMYNGVIYTDEAELAEAQKDYVREIRNSYLVEYVDGVVSNPLRWADMSDELKQMYTDYRRYLLDYTEGENWWLQLPKTLEEWAEKVAIRKAWREELRELEK